MTGSLCAVDDALGGQASLLDLGRKPFSLPKSPVIVRNPW
jgi:hypothetical protein